MRESGTFRSAASVIEAVRLAEAFASLHRGSLPILSDLHDAAITCLGYGESPLLPMRSQERMSERRLALAEGVSQTPIQDDLNRNLKTLKLEKYKTTVAS